MIRFILLAICVFVSIMMWGQVGWYGHHTQGELSWLINDQIDEGTAAFNGKIFHDFSSSWTPESTPYRHSSDIRNSLEADILTQRVELLVKRFLFPQDRLSPSHWDDYLYAELLHQKEWENALFYNDWTSKHNSQSRTFTKGYAYWQLENFDQAVAHFLKMKPTDVGFTISEYLLGVYYARSGEYEEALSHFTSIENRRDFQDVLPLLKAQLYWNQNKFAEAVRIDEVVGTRYQPLLQRIKGLSHIRMGNWNEGLFELEKYAESANYVPAKDRLLMGTGYYQMQSYSEAYKHLELVAHLDDSTGQIANYYLGDLYLLDEKKKDARNAFLQCSRIDALHELSEQSYYYAGKISAEMGDDRDAIRILKSFRSDSPYFSSAQNILADVLRSTEDYASALSVFKEISEPSIELRRAMHQLLYLQAIEWFHSENWEEAKQAFSKLAHPSNPDQFTNTHAIYWTGEMAYRDGDIQNARKSFEKIVDRKINGQTVDDQLLNKANYGLGYTLMGSDTRSALKNFETVQKVEGGENMWHDAQIKIADLNLQMNQYSDALDQYNVVLNSKSPHASYALYQKALIFGLQDLHVKKIVQLEELINRYPKSSWADDALVEWGKTALRIQEPEEALKVYQQFLDKYEGRSAYTVQVLNQSGLVSLNLGSPSEAVSYYKRVFQYNPTGQERQTALDALEEIYIKELGRPDVYLEFIEDQKLVSLPNPRKDSLSYYSAIYQFENGKLIKAKESLKSYLNIFPNGQNVGDANYYLGEIALSKKEYSEALAYYREACESSSRIFDACYKAGEIASLEPNTASSSISYYRKALDRNENPEKSHQARTGMLRAFILLNQFDTTLALAEEVAKYDKVSDDEVELATYYTAKYHVYRGDSLLAVNPLNKLSKGSGERAAESRYLISLIYYHNNQVDLALQLCEQANKKNSAYPNWLGRGLILQSDILRSQNQPLNARAALQAVMDYFEESNELHGIAKKKLEELDSQLNQKNKLTDE